MRKGCKFFCFCLLLLLSLLPLLTSACARPESSSATQETHVPSTTQGTTVASDELPQQEMPLVIAFKPFAGSFSPFFAEAESDQAVVQLTSLYLLTLERGGDVVAQAASREAMPYAGKTYTYEGIANTETEYDDTTDTTTFTFTLRDDLYFSDGQSLTADDVIFSFYVFFDPAYPLHIDLHDLPVLGAIDYKRQISQDTYDQYTELAHQIYTAGQEHSWSEDDSWSEVQQTAFWKQVKTAWADEIQAIIDYTYTTSRGHAEQYTGYKPSEIDRAERKAVLAMSIWDFARLTDEGSLTGVYSEKVWKIAQDEYPSAEDFLQETWLAYKGNPEAFWGIEGVSETPVLSVALDAFVTQEAAQAEATGGEGVAQIAGIKKLDERTVSVTIAGDDPDALKKLNIPVAPLHYYGDHTLYDYAKNQFGFSRSDLSVIQQKSAVPLGAGPYQFEKYQDKTVSMTANASYFKGEPEIKNLQLKETVSDDLIAAVGSGISDLASVEPTKTALADILRYNQDSRLSGNRIFSLWQAEPAYSYIGINATAVKSGLPSSEASRLLRKGLATVFSACRTSAGTEPLQPILVNAPTDRLALVEANAAQPAYAVDPDGNQLYRVGMSREQILETARSAARAYFIEAGFTADESGQRLIQAPDGAALLYQLHVLADAMDQPLTADCLKTATMLLAEIGIRLDVITVEDPLHFSELLQRGDIALWYGVRAMDVAEVFFAAYHSNEISKSPLTGGLNTFRLSDKSLDDLLETAAHAADDTEKDQLYQSARDKILDWAVEVPLYLERSLTVLSAQRVDQKSLPADPTGFWNWLHEMENLKTAE